MIRGGMREKAYISSFLCSHSNSANAIELEFEETEGDFAGRKRRLRFVNDSQKHKEGNDAGSKL